MAVTNDCEHKVPEFLCRHCAGKDRSGGILACDVVPADHKQTKTVERRVLDAATAVEEVHRGPVGLVKKSALDSGDAATPVQANDGGKLATSDDKEADGHAENIAAAMPERAPTVFPAEPVKAGKGGESGVFEITNAEFIAAAIRELPEGAFAAVCSKPGNPSQGGWPAHRADDRVSAIVAADRNNYFGCSSFYPGDDGSFKARKAQFAACHFLMLDDIGIKVPMERLRGFELSWLIETSPGNHQGGILLATPITDGAVAARLHNAIIDAGLCDAGAREPLSRWARLPVAINGKPKYADNAVAPFPCRLVEWRPDKRYSPQEIVDLLQLQLAPSGRPQKPAAQRAKRPTQPGDADEVLTPKAVENPIVAAPIPEVPPTTTATFPVRSNKDLPMKRYRPAFPRNAPARRWRDISARFQ